MSEEESPPRKKQRTCGLPKYEFIEKPNLTRPLGVDDIKMNDYDVSRNNISLYTSGCASCIALIVVTKMDNGEIWYGLYHSSDIGSESDIHEHFGRMENVIEGVASQNIKDVNYYVVINPQYKDEYMPIFMRLEYTCNILMPEYHGRQLGLSDDITDDAHIGSMDVKLSDGLIEVKYNQPIHS